MLSNLSFAKKTKTTIQLLSAFSMFMIVGMLASNIHIEKSFAVEKVPLIPVNSSDASLNSDMGQFYKCIKKSVKDSQSPDEPSYFKNEPTKTEVAVCYKNVFSTQNQ